MSRRISKPLLCVAAASAALALGAGSASAAQVFDVNFTPLNGSGASGTASLMLNDAATSLTVTIDATGLEAGVPHVAHIHGLFSGGLTGTPINSTTPTLAQDADHDGFVELAEGQTTYGPIIIPFGNIDPAMTSTVHFSQVFDLTNPATFAGGYTRADLLGAGLNSLDLREIVIHGLTVPPGPGAGTPGEVNGTNGFLGVLPVLSGEIMAVPEPESWALMILGFGAMGGSLRLTRRRRQAASLGA